MTRPFSTRLLAASALAVLALTACSGGDAEDGADPAPAASSTGSAAAGSSGTSSASPSGTPSAVPSSAETSGIDPQNPPEPIASATVPAVSPDGSDHEATMRVDLLGLERRDRLVVATFAFTPSSTDDTPGWLYDWLGNQGWRPYLVDTTNLRRHDVVQGEGLKYASEYQGSKFASGQTWYAYAGFAAPPADVTTMDVAAVDGAPAFRAVPLS